MVDIDPQEATDMNQQVEETKNSARRRARFFTFFYIVLFPFFFYMAMLSPMVFERPSMPSVGFLNIFLTFLIPLSMPVSIYLMWSRYSQGLYKRTHFFSALPILVFIAWFILAGILDKLARYFA